MFWESPHLRIKIRSKSILIQYFTLKIKNHGSINNQYNTNYIYITTRMSCTADRFTLRLSTRLKLPRLSTTVTTTGTFKWCSCFLPVCGTVRTWSSIVCIGLASVSWTSGLVWGIIRDPSRLPMFDSSVLDPRADRSEPINHPHTH